MLDHEGIIHLDSNAIDKRVLNNTTASFTNYLTSSHIYSSDKYEAALLDIHIPFTWCNISKPQYAAIFDNKSLKIKHNTLLRIEPMHYKNISDVVNLLNLKIFNFIYKFPAKLQDDLRKIDHLKKYEISYDGRSNRVYANLAAEFVEPELGADIEYYNQEVFPDCHWRFTPELADIIGFTDNQFVYLPYDKETDSQNKIAELAKMQSFYFNQKPDMILKYQFYDKTLQVEDDVEGHGGFYEVYDHRLFESSNKKYETLSQRQPDITWGMDYIFCYSDLVKGHGVAGTSTPLLRALPVTSLPDYGKILSFSFVNPHFYPLSELSFDRVSIELRDRTGEFIPFLSGSVIALIEIRKRRKKGYGE